MPGLTGHLLFLSEEHLQDAAGVVEVAAEFVLQEALVRVADILRQVAEEGETRRRRRQLRNVFDLDVFPFPGRRRIVLDFGQHHLVELRGGDAAGIVGEHVFGGFQHIHDALLVRGRGENDRNVAGGRDALFDGSLVLLHRIGRLPIC